MCLIQTIDSQDISISEANNFSVLVGDVPHTKPHRSRQTLESVFRSPRRDVERLCAEADIEYCCRSLTPRAERRLMIPTERKNQLSIV